MSLGRSNKKGMHRKPRLGRGKSSRTVSTQVDEVAELNKIRDSLRDYIVDKDEDGCVKALQYLHKKNYLAVSDLEEKDGSGKSLLYWACYLEQLAIVAALLEYGATPSHVEVHAALSGKYGKKITACLALLVKRLKEKGTDALLKAINTKSNDWDGAALHVALARADPNDIAGLEKRVNMLLEAKADISATVQKGTSPLHMCAENGWFELSKTLLVHCMGSKTSYATMLDSKGRTAHQVAHDRGHTDLANYLERREAEELPDPPIASDLKHFLRDSSTDDNETKRTVMHTSLSSPVQRRATTELDITFSPLSGGIPKESVVEATMAVLNEGQEGSRSRSGTQYDALNLPLSSPATTPRLSTDDDRVGKEGETLLDEMPRGEQDELPVIDGGGAPGGGDGEGGSDRLVEMFREAEDARDESAPQEKTLASFLGELSLEKYVEVCESEDIDLMALKLLDDADLKELGLGLGARRKIQRALQNEG